MNADTILLALSTNLEDADELTAKAKSIDVDTSGIPDDVLQKLYERFTILGMADHVNKIKKFVNKIKNAIDEEEKRNQEKSQQRQEQEAQATVAESQYKYPDDKHTRDQSSYPSNVGSAKSHGGVTKSKFLEKLSKSIKSIEEDVAIKDQEITMDANSGKLFINGETVIDNHADVLKLLSIWLLDNDPEALKVALNGIKEMIDNGAFFN